MRRLLSVLVLFILGSSAALAQSPSEGLTGEPPPLPALSDWGTTIGGPRRLGGSSRLTVREEAGWFRIGLPEGWQINADRASGHIVLTGPDRRGIHLWLLLMPRVNDARQGAALLAAISRQITPSTRWSQPNVAAHGARTTIAARGSDGDFARAAGLSLIQAERMTVAFYVLASAPGQTFADSRDLFAAILESFAPVGGSDEGSSDVAYQRWTDPIEHAFSAEVPKGWTAEGGTVRKSAVDVRQVMRVVNPEQSIMIQAGDPEIPPFQEPTAFMREGQANGSVLVRRYTPGAQFGRDYVEWRLKKDVPDLTFDAVRPLPELQRAVQDLYDRYYAPIGMNMRVDIGEVLFHGTWNRRPSRGHLFAATTRVAVRGSEEIGAMWFTGGIDSLGGFFAAEDQVENAAAVMAHMRDTFVVDQNWFATQQRTTMEVSRITTETNNYISNLIRRGYQQRQATLDKVYERYSRVMRGVTQVRDPDTQQNYEVQAGSNYYWIDNQGRVVGTNAPFNPDPLWFREMLQVN